jgi:hypothetical protein
MIKMERKQFDEKRENRDFFEMIQEEIDGFSKDGENREIYIHFREKFTDVEERIQRGELVSGAEEPRERYDKKSPQKFSWDNHFWTSKANFLRIVKQLNPKITRKSILNEEDRKECQRMEMGNTEWYRTNIPYLRIHSYRSYENIDTQGFEKLSQFQLCFRVEYSKRTTGKMPMDIKVNLDKISQAKKISEKLKEQWRKEFNDEQRRDTSIIKLWKFDKFAETLIKEPGQMLNCGGYTIMFDNENGENITHISGYGFHSGSILKWTPRSYQWIIDELEQHFSAKNIIQDFIGDFYSTWIYIPEQWLPAIKKILETPVSAEEIQKIDEIVEKNKLKIANAWLWEAENYAEGGWHEKAFRHITKAESVSSGIDKAEIEKIKSLARKKGVEKEIELSLYWYNRDELHEATLHLDEANELAKDTGQDLSNYNYIYKWAVFIFLKLADERSERSKEKFWIKDGIVKDNLNFAKEFAKKAGIILPDDKVEKIEKRLRGNILARAIKKFS